MANGIVIVFDDCFRDNTRRWRSLEGRSRHELRIIEVVVADAHLRLHDASPAGIGGSQRAECGGSAIALLVENHVLNEVRFVQILELQFVYRPLQLIDHSSHDRIRGNSGSLTMDGSRCRHEQQSTDNAFPHNSPFHYRPPIAPAGGARMGGRSDDFSFF